MRGRIGGMGATDVAELVMMVSLAVVILLLRETRARFSLKWLLLFITFAAVFFGMASIFVGALLRGPK
jgi:hypothetical protein